MFVFFCSDSFYGGCFVTTANLATKAVGVRHFTNIVEMVPDPDPGIAPMSWQLFLGPTRVLHQCRGNSPRVTPSNSHLNELIRVRIFKRIPRKKVHVQTTKRHVQQVVDIVRLQRSRCRCTPNHRRRVA